MPNLKCKRCEARLLEEKWGLYWRRDDGAWYCFNCAEALRTEKNDKGESERNSR